MRTPRYLLLFFMLVAISSADILQNQDFETPPLSTKPNATSPFLLLTEANTIPGWSFSGKVSYVTAGPKSISLPGNGHAVQLGDGGKINQTIRDNGINQGYVLSFILASVRKDCFNNLTSVKVSVPGRSKVFSLNGGYGKEMWETHGFYMGRDPFQEPFNLMIEKASTDKMDDKLVCDPVVDSFLVKGLGIPKVYGDTMLVNNGFEEGPGFLGNFSQGILLHEEPDELQSPLQRWSIKGTVKFIDSKHYSVAEGIAAVELISGSPSGILTTASLSKHTNYNLVFTLGDANDSCVAEFTVFAQAGKTKQNFTRQRDGTGLFKSCSMAFKAESSKTEISIVSFDQRQTSDQLYCGPVIDNIMVQSSSVQLNLQLGITFLSWVLGVVILNIS